MKEFILKADIYRILSRIFSYPGEIEALRKIAEEISDEVKRKYPSIYSNVEELVKIEANKKEKLIEEYSRTFMKGIIPISEGSYTLDHAGDVTGFYLAFGVKPKKGEAPDSLPYELEFLSYLCLKIAVAPDKEKKSISISAYRKFIDDHLSRWVGKFCRKVKESDIDSFYKNGADMLEKWLKIEMNGISR